MVTTDHGEYAGEHGLAGKNQLYETACRIPMIIHWPRGIRPGLRVDNVLSTVDFQPTLRGLAGVPTCGREQGRDAGMLLRRKPSDWQDCAFLHHASHSRAGVFAKDAELALVRDGDSILFDRIHDPDQTRNLFCDPAYADTVAALTQRVVEHHLALETSAADWLKHLHTSNSAGRE